MRIKTYVAPALLLVVAGVLLVRLPFAIADRADDYEFFDTLIDIRHLLDQRFVEEPDAKAMQEAMITGMLETLDDPHTIFIPPRYADDFNKDLRGTYVGIGAEVTLRDGYLTIISPMDGSPALKGGVMAGDVVLEIEGESTLNKPINEAIDLLLGEPGTHVTIKVRHLDETEEDLVIERGRIVTQTVRGLRRLGESWTYCLDEELELYYVRVTQFNEPTVAKLREVLERLVADGMKGLLLDLRDNPGGDLRAAVQMSDLFLDDGVIVSVRDRKGEGPTFSAETGGTLPDFAMIALINGASASASEIVSGALQENGRAKVLGTRSHGKGSVQEVRELPFGRGTLKITSAYYYLPSDRSIHRRRNSGEWGVDPDEGMLIAVADSDYIEKIRARQQFEIIRDAEADASECSWPDWIRESLKDEQLATALEFIQEKVLTDFWPEGDDEDDAGRIALEEELRRGLQRRSDIMEGLNRIETRIAELQEMAGEVGHEPVLPEDADLLAGTITIRNREGEVIGEYRIDGGDVALALETIEVTKLEE